MEFSEFAGLLYPIIGGGDTTGRFTRKLFEKITDIPVSKVDDNPLIDQSDETFKSYFNGTRAIRLLAKKINPYIDITIFEAFIYSSKGGGRPWDAAIPTGMGTGPRKPPYRENGRDGAHSRTPWQTSSSQAARAANARKN